MVYVSVICLNQELYMKFVLLASNSIQDIFKIHKILKYSFQWKGVSKFGIHPLENFNYIVVQSFEQIVKVGETELL